MTTGLTLWADSTQLPLLTVTYGGAAMTNVLSASITSGWDQSVATASVIVGTDPSITPDNATQVVIAMGYRDPDTLTTYTTACFTGYVDDVVAGRIPNTWEIKCRDVLKRAVDTWLDDVGVTGQNVQAEDAVCYLLKLAGLTNIYYDVTSFTLADVEPYTMKLISIMEGCQQIASLIGWRLWATPTGKVLFKYVRPRQSGSSVCNYTVGTHPIIKYDYTVTDRDLRNRIVVVGYQGNGVDIRSESSAVSPYVADPPKYRTAIYSNEFIDTHAMADAIAPWMLSELNQLVYVLDITAAGNPWVNVGDTITFTDSGKSIAATRFLVYSVRRTLDASRGTFLDEIQAVHVDMTDAANYSGGDPTGDPPTPPDDPPVPPTPPTNYGASYDIDGGCYPAFTTGLVEEGGIGNAVTWHKVMLGASGNITSWTLYVNGVSKLSASRSGGTWTVAGVGAGTDDVILVTLATAISVTAPARVRVECVPNGSVSDYAWAVCV